MIEMASCFGDEALKFSTPSCSFASTKSSYISPSPSIRDVIAYVYRISLPSRETQLLVVVTWCVSPGGTRVIVEFNGHCSAKDSPCVRIGTDPGLLGRNRGRKRLECGSLSVVVSWDFSKARFDVGSPEPVGGFNVAVSVDSELVLVLGEGGRAGESGTAKSLLVSKREELFGDGSYGTRARFGRNGEPHDILIKCGGAEREKEEGNDEQKHCPTLRVYVDKKLVTRVKRLQWNFRGSQTIFVDGSAVDFMWNVHNWFHNIGAGPGVFTFRTTSENEVVDRDSGSGSGADGYGHGFSLLICANKNPS